MENTQKLEISADLSKKLERTKELASYCYSCGKCLTVCPTSLLGIFSPKGFIHDLTIEGDNDLDLFVKKEKLFNCLTCEQCAIYCPMAYVEKEQGVLIAEIVQGIREYGFYRGLLDDELYEGQTHDNIMEISPRLQSDLDGMINKMDFLKNDVTLETADEGEVAYFVGCSSMLGSIFDGNGVKYSDVPRGAIAALNEGGIVPVVLNTKCCGHDSYWIGDVETAKKLAKYNVDVYKKAGVKTIIVECAEGYRMWKYDYPKLVEDCDFEVKHFTEYIVEKNITKTIVPIFSSNVKVTYHDPCRLGRLGGRVYDAPREVLKNIPGVELVEMENIRDDSNCCGVSAFRCCNSKTKLLRENRVHEAIDTGAEYLITTCPKCITHFNCYVNEIDDEGNERPEKKQIKIMDLASFISKFTQKI